MKYYLTIVAILILSGCSKLNQKKVNYERIGIECLIKKNAEYIITSKAEFDLIASEIFDDQYSGYCDQPPHAPFSFNDFVLIGKYTRTDSNDKLYLDVYIDKKRNKLVYRIELDFEPGPVNNGGYGNIYGVGMNWVKVPKPPSDQEIIIEYVVL